MAPEISFKRATTSSVALISAADNFKELTFMAKYAATHSAKIPQMAIIPITDSTETS
jgi:hypothetical protein